MEELVVDIFFWHKTAIESVGFINELAGVESKSEEDLKALKANVLHLDHLITKFDFAAEGLETQSITDAINLAKRLY